MKVVVCEASSAADRAAHDEFRTAHADAADRLLYRSEDELEWDAARYVLLARDARGSGMGAILGTAVGWHIGGIAKITDLMVDAHVRRRGIARTLVEAFESRARAARCHRTHAVTVAGSGAEAFWRRVGWEVVARLPDHYFGIEHVVLSRKLE